MPFPPDSRVLGLLSVFDDPLGLATRYSAPSSCEGRQYVHRAHAGDLDVTVWTHSDTAWVCLRGLLGRRAARALATVLMSTDVSGIVLNAVELTLLSASGGTPLVTLCATLSCAGYSVAVVGREDDVAFEEAELPGGQPDLLVATSA